MSNALFPILLIKTIIQICFELLKAWTRFVIPKKWISKSVKNNIILITGAGSGLGAALAVKFAKRKARLILWDINKEGLNNTMEQCRRYQSESSIFTFIVDVTDRNQVLETSEKIKSSIGFVDILINNAGIVNGKSVFDLTAQNIDKTFQVNVFSHFWTVQAFVPQMIARDSGQIVSISSLAGQCGVNRLSDYCASKFAAVGFLEALTNELYSLNCHGVTTLNVCPYYINTGMFNGVETDSPLLKIMDIDFAASKIETAILTNASFLMIPRITYFLIFLKSFLPVKATMYLGDLVGATKSMELFIGRKSI